MKQVTVLKPTEIVASKIMVDIDPEFFWGNNYHSCHDDEVKGFVKGRLSEYCNDVEVGIVSFALADDFGVAVSVVDESGDIYPCPELASCLLGKASGLELLPHDDLFDYTLEQVYGHLLGG